MYNFNIRIINGGNNMNFRPLNKCNLYIVCASMIFILVFSSVYDAKSMENKNLFSVDVYSMAEKCNDNNVELLSLESDRFKLIYNKISQKLNVIYDGILQKFSWDFERWHTGWHIKVFYKDKKVAIILTTGSGAGIHTEELHLLDLNDLSREKVLNAENIKQVLSENIKSTKVTIDGNKTYINIALNSNINYSIDISDECDELKLTEEERLDIEPWLGDVINYHIDKSGNINLEILIGLDRWLYTSKSISMNIATENDG